MNPALTEYVSNSNDPPADDEGGPTASSKKKKQFMSIHNFNELETKRYKTDYNIANVYALILDSSRRVHVTKETNAVDASVAKQDAANATTEYDAFVQNEIDSTANTLLNETGVDSAALYRCAFEGCTWLKTDEREFLMHLVQHQGDGATYKCAHCKQMFALPVDLKNHIKIHLKHRFFCYYCDTTASSQYAINQHFETNHNNEDAQYLPLNPMKFDLDKDIFVVCPKGVENINDFITRVVKRVDERQAAKQSYLPEEIDLLPKRMIFAEEIQCGRCNYSNKVRTNLVRHFKNGCTERQAPVNPVPCLSSSERHFDKMRNLAASSNPSDTSAELILGKFVPEEKRYVCGAKSCQYQTLCADMLQQHIVTLHATEQYFRCPHCGDDLSNCSTPTEILNHFRYHDSKIFRCPYCQFIHYLKPQVEKHINETHPASKDRAITLDRPVKKAETAKIANKPVTYKWACNICLKMFNTRALVKSHVSETHRLAYQFKCSLCSYSSDTKTAVKDHLMTEHRENDPLKIKSHFDRVESEADNSPIWKRDPTRVSCFFFHFNFCTCFLE